MSDRRDQAKSQVRSQCHELFRGSLTLGGAQADPMVLCLGMAAGVLLLAGLGRAAFRSGYGLMDQVLDPKQDQPRN
ncbi:hypothetical protein ACFFJ4_22635 [Xanthomonas dyei]|uniref:Uncharacterized protein n=1 Tax=Xanthomonas dyei TaxID=743699 RepID=A0A2S7BGH2_9XANT|nr:hypothetical protein [Xanthomonas dyei]PPU44367.1 hypothetical protein XdyCFBP7245_22980 [Xanthomonas dyei]